MRIHHLNCVTACPLGGMLMDGVSTSLSIARLTSHCLLVESKAGLVLVDTGYGLNDVRDPRGRLSAFFLALNRPDLREEITAARQIERLGFSTRDVRHIVLTHLDFDHAGGLDDFPAATVHLLGTEVEAATRRQTMLDRMRYRPQQWSSMSRWVRHAVGGDAFFELSKVAPIRELADEIALVPLPGHTVGHAGVAVRGHDRWILLAGDAYFYCGEMDVEDPHCTPGLTAYQLLMDKDHATRLANQRRLRELKQAHGDEVEIVCSHDVTEFERVAHRRYDELAERGVRAGEHRVVEAPRETPIGLM